jgi:multiple sugar transport system substrate-binding protein
MKRITIVFTLLVAVLALAIAPSFAQEDERDYESISADQLDGTTVEFWHQHSGFRETQLEAIVAVFNNPDIAAEDVLETIGYGGDDEAERERLLEIVESLRDVAREYNPYGITVDASNQGGYGDIFTKVTTALAGGGEGLPDLVVAYQNQAATYEVVDGVINIEPLLMSEQWGIDEAGRDDFFDAFYNADVFPTFGGERLGFPPNRSMEVMYYNIDWLNELSDAGAIDFDGPPQTPDQFRQAACAAVANPFSGATGANNPLGYQLSSDASRFASWTFGFGGDVFDYDAGQYSYDSDAAVEAMTFLRGLFEDGCADLVFERFGDQANFGAGTTLFTIGSSSGLPFYRGAVEDGAGFEWSVAAVPHITETPVQNIYGASVSIPVGTPVEELAAWLFVKFYTAPEVQAQWAQASNYFPVRESVADGLTDYFAANPAYEAAFSLLEFGRTEPPVPGYDPVRDEVEIMMTALVTGDDDRTVEEILAELTEFANEELELASAGMDMQMEGDEG